MILFWSLVCCRGLIGLQRGLRTAGTNFYDGSEVLEKTLATTMQRKTKMDHQPKVEILLDMSRNFSSRTELQLVVDRKTQDWCHTNFPGFWEKGTCPLTR